MHIGMMMSSYQGESTFQSGAELQAHTQIQLLKSRGCTITVITKKRSSHSKYKEFINGTAIYRVFPAGLRSIRAALLLLQHRRQFDVVHIHGQHLFSTPVIVLCKLLAIPTVLKITIAGQTTSPMALDKLLPRGWNPCRRLINQVSRLTSVYLAISTEIADELKSQGIAPNKIVALPNGVNTERFHPVTSEVKQQLRHALGLPSDKKVLLYASRLIGRKGYDIMLEAWKSIQLAYPEAVFLVVGKGSSEAIHALEQLQQELGKDAIFYKGEVPDTAPYLQACDLFMFPSRQEGLPNALLEAMACGCACVASDIGGCSDLIISGENGLLFPSGDPVGLADAVKLLMSKPDQMDAVGQKAHETIKANHDIAIIGENLLQLYCKLINER
ncbi:glycosyltransferase family 4 protein [Sporomusa sphaeroides]|uniref:glycosyltransferase family 4 protein n=1 Tax=Sporomusa sphaeroides TaxID=47679 RepID=UPI002B65A6D0|nr:glycosyltransferase family 4 protein [Sporomusa sphaeroides]HML34138.1 glycosyltransferase family 4 protein [Sporomusa sphaeroides]